ncbi:retrovirus-related pol polyprotein from transposon TNT 1-94 [Tanacetum coccineum]
MTTPITTSTTDSQMHNNIMAAGSRDRPPMLATGRYAQWRSRFLRYIDTKTNGDALRKCILEGPYIPSTVVIQVVPATENSPAVPEHTTVETILNMSPANKAHFESEKEAIHMILTGIGDEIYSTVDACNTAHEMWEAIERLQQGESLNIQDVKTNLFWEFGKFTSHDGESIESYYSRFYKLMNEMIRNNLTVDKMQVNVQFLQQLQPEWSRFVTIVKQQHKLDEVSYHKFFDILKQYQKEVNELRAERIAKNANPLALVATAQPHQDPYYQTSKSHKSYAQTSKACTSNRSHATKDTKKDKEMQKNLALIAKYFKKLYKPTNNNLRTSSNTRNKNVDTTPRYKNDNQSRQFGNQRTMTVVGARETVGGHVVQQSGIQCFNCKEFGHFAKECRKPKWVKDITYHKEKILLGKQAEKGVQLQAEQSDWLADTDEEIDEQKLEAHYNYMAKIQEVPNTDSDMETVDSNVIPDLPDMCDNYIQNDQNDVECDDERVALANLIANLKLDVDENKKIQKQLKKANASLTQELKECKSTLAETSRTLGESNSIRDSCLVTLQNKQTEFERYKAFNDRTVDYDKLERKLNETLRLLAQKDIDIKEGLKVKAYEISIVKEKHDELVKHSLLTKSHYEGLVKEKTKNDTFAFIHELKQEMHADLKYVESLEKEVDELESDKAEFSNVYDMLLSPQLPQTSRNINPCVSTSTGVIHNTSVSRPQLRSTQMKEKVMHNNSQVKFKKTEIVQLIIFIVDSRCNKHMTGNLKLLCNFVEKYLGTFRFENDQFAPILGYGDLVQGNITIKRVYYVEGLNHNLFSVSQFCDADLEVAFWKSTCFVRDLQGNDLLTDNRGSDLYIMTLQETTSPTPICFMAKASPTQAWLWHCRLSHLNFDTINLLTKKDIMIGLPKLKYVKDQLGTKFLNKTLHAYFKKKALNIKLPLLGHLNRMALSKDGTILSLRLLERCSQLLNFFYSFGLKL